MILNKMNMGYLQAYKHHNLEVVHIELLEQVYKNLAQKMHFIKYFKWTYKGHNLAILIRISKN